MHDCLKQDSHDYWISRIKNLILKLSHLFNPENPLESDIEIVAKPKGKRPKVLNQLSGGEKTLTATALLFSLYLLKPAPFCVFDEVDAPLDDANIAKFNKIIKEFSSDSQFMPMRKSILKFKNSNSDAWFSLCFFRGQIF